MRVAYGEPNVLQCSVQFAYDRFFTSFESLEGAVPLPRQTDIDNQAKIKDPGLGRRMAFEIEQILNAKGIYR